MELDGFPYFAVRAFASVIVRVVHYVVKGVDRGLTVALDACRDASGPSDMQQRASLSLVRTLRVAVEFV